MIVDSRIEDYCIQQSSTPSSLLDEIYTLTHKTQQIPQMLIGKMEASFLGFLIKSLQIKNVLEIGTFTGYSALSMAEVLPPEGKIITVDVNSSPIEEIAKPIWNKSSHGSKIESIITQGTQYLTETKKKFDLIFIDADKQNYLRYVELSLNCLSKTGIIVVDNALWSGHVADPQKNDDSTEAIRKLNNWAQSQDNLYTSLIPVRDGLLLLKPL